MKNRFQKVAFIATIATLLPLLSHAQGVAADINSLQGVLNTLYDQMIPLCSQVIGVGQGIAGFAALWYIAVRVWKHIAAAEPVDFYPLLRPFVIGFCILNFTSVLALINGVLSPTVTATEAMVGTSNQVIANLTNTTTNQSNNNPVINPGSDPDKWYQYSNPGNSGTSGSTSGNLADQFTGWGLTSMFQRWVAYFLNVCFEAAALCIDTIRTFKLIVLAILGPLCFGLSVFDGFQHTLKQWLARYVNVYMWLPVANIFGAIIAKIQANMIQLQQSGAASNSSFTNGNTIYLIFLLIGIVGYFTVPSIANYIINVGGHALFSKTSALASTAIAFSTGQVAQAVQVLKQVKGNGNPSQPGQSSSSGSSGAGGSNYMKDKLSGKSP